MVIHMFAMWTVVWKDKKVIKIPMWEGSIRIGNNGPFYAHCVAGLINGRIGITILIKSPEVTVR